MEFEPYKDFLKLNLAEQELSNDILLLIANAVKVNKNIDMVKVLQQIIDQHILVESLISKYGMNKAFNMFINNMKDNINDDSTS